MIRDSEALVFWCEKGFFCPLAIQYSRTWCRPSLRVPRAARDAELASPKPKIPNPKSWTKISNLAHPYQNQGIVPCQKWIPPCIKMHLWDIPPKFTSLSSSLNFGFYSCPQTHLRLSQLHPRSCSRGCSYRGEIINDPRCNYLCLEPCSGSADIFPEEGGGVSGRHLAV